MKRLSFFLFLLVSCQEPETTQENFTGNQVVYSLEAGSNYAVSGTVTIKEKIDGNAFLAIHLTGTAETLLHPAHLHLGDLSIADTEIAALLTPVVGKTGKSETTLSFLADESPVRYSDLLVLNACIKIHLAESGPDRNVILAGTNIGSAQQAKPSAKVGMAMCQ